MDFTPQEQKIIDALKALGATAPDKLKNADQIMITANLAKGFGGNILTNLCNKGVVKRVAREKAAGYFLAMQL